MYICDIEFVGCAIFPSSRIARKGTMPSLKVMEHNPVRLLNYFQVKSFGFGPILQIDRPIVSFLIFEVKFTKTDFLKYIISIMDK